MKTILEQYLETDLKDLQSAERRVRNAVQSVKSAEAELTDAKSKEEEKRNALKKYIPQFGNHKRLFLVEGTVMIIERSPASGDLMVTYEDIEVPEGTIRALSNRV